MFESTSVGIVVSMRFTSTCQSSPYLCPRLVVACSPVRFAPVCQRLTCPAPRQSICPCRTPSRPLSAPQSQHQNGHLSVLVALKRIHVRFRHCLLHMLSCRAVMASCASRLRPAPNALAVARSVTMLAGRRMVAPSAITHRAAPLATRGIVSVLVLAGRRMMTSRPITRRAAVPTLRLVLLSHNRLDDQSEAERNYRYCFRIVDIP